MKKYRVSLDKYIEEEHVDEDEARITFMNFLEEVNSWDLTVVDLGELCECGDVIGHENRPDCHNDNFLHNGPRCCHGDCPAPATVWRGPTPYCETHAKGR